MKIKFLATRVAPLNHSISGSAVNDIDISAFVEGSRFTGNDDTRAAGIVNMYWEGGDLHIVLGQKYTRYEIPTNRQYWSESDWIDVADYDPDRCYIVATTAPENAEYVKRDNGWTVVVPETEEPAA